MIGFEAAALRHADSLNDEDLATLAVRSIRTLIKHECRPQTFRELAAASLVMARRMDSEPSEFVNSFFDPAGSTVTEQAYAAGFDPFELEDLCDADD
jgi:hypothetical protein